MGHSNPAITAKTYARVFDEARHAEAIRAAMETSALGAVLEPWAQPEPQALEAEPLAAVVPLAAVAM